MYVYVGSTVGCEASHPTAVARLRFYDDYTNETKPNALELVICVLTSSRVAETDRRRITGPIANSNINIYAETAAEVRYRHYPTRA